MADSSHTILERFRTTFGADMSLGLRPAYFDLLEKLGNPQDHLPPVFHVAGTNGKGSTCAFLRAMLEADGYKVHVYTSPHLVRFHERIRVAGNLIEESELAEILARTEKLSHAGGVTLFEAATAAAFVAFVRHQADFTILETGLGGRLDATNVVKKPLATLITRLSYDHRPYLGDTMDKIAREKAGIMRDGVPCFTSPQPDALALATLRAVAAATGAPLYIGGEAWKTEPTGKGFRFSDATHAYDLPEPALLGPHQYQNAGLAIAALATLPRPLAPTAIEKGVQAVEWPARLQRLSGGRLAALVPPNVELWLDGGHNDSAGEVLAAQAKRWHEEDGAAPKPLSLIFGMLTTKDPVAFLSPLAPYVSSLRAVAIPDEPLGFSPAVLANEAHKTNIPHSAEATNVEAALRDIIAQKGPTPQRILICGSLYLAGAVLGIP